jgi:hypothetical protein
MVSFNRGHFIGALLGFVLYYSLFLANEHFFSTSIESGGKITKPSLQIMISERVHNLTSFRSAVDSADRSQGVHPSDSGHSLLSAETKLQPALEAESKIEIKRPADDHVSPSHDLAVHINECLDMKSKYHVAPGASWGSLPQDLQRSSSFSLNICCRHSNISLFLLL